MNTASANQEVNKSINKRSPKFKIGQLFRYGGCGYKIIDVLIGSTIIAYYCERTQVKHMRKIVEESCLLNEAS